MKCIIGALAVLLLLAGCNSDVIVPVLDKPIGFMKIAPKGKPQAYVYKAAGGVMVLDTLGEIEGEGDMRFVVEASKSPWVLNAHYQRTSKLSCTFDVTILQGGVGPMVWMNSNGVYWAVGNGKGNWVVAVTSVGCKWHVAVGAE